MLYQFCYSLFSLHPRIKPASQRISQGLYFWDVLGVMVQLLIYNHHCLASPINPPNKKETNFFIATVALSGGLWRGKYSSREARRTSIAFPPWWSLYIWRGTKGGGNFNELLSPPRSFSAGLTDAALCPNPTAVHSPHAVSFAYFVSCSTKLAFITPSPPPSPSSAF